MKPNVANAINPCSTKCAKSKNNWRPTGRNLEAVQKSLADQTIYTDPDRKAELTGLVKDQASLKTTIDTLEWDWMEASEALEIAG